MKYKFLLFSFFPFLFFSNQTSAQVMGNGLLDAREYTIVGCDYGPRNGNNCVNPNITGERTNPNDTPITLYMPAYPNNGQVINNICDDDQVNNSGIPSTRATPTTCNASTPGVNVYWPGAPASTVTPLGPSLLGSIFTGTDAFGLPDIPDPATSLWDDVTGKVNGGALSLQERSATCTATQFVIQDAGGINGNCGQMSTARASADWAITEGFIVMPPTATGTVLFSSNNVGVDNVARTNYVAMLLSPDSNFANLQFVGEAQSEFRDPSEVTFEAAASPSDDVCDVNFQAMRLYVHDDFSGASSTVTWSLDGGATYEPIPANRYANDSNAPGLVCGDRGDAPDSYRTLNATGGPVHAMDSELFLGTLAGADDNDGQPTAGADGDDVDADGDDEDGTDPATWPLVLQNVTTYSVDIDVTNLKATDAQLVGWIDFNFDGDFDDPGERSLPGTPTDCPAGNASVGTGVCTFTTGNVLASSGPATYTLHWADVSINGPASTVQDTYSRFRVTTDPSFFSDTLPEPGGVTQDGEVEDFLVPADTLPVTLSSFSSARIGNKIDVDWGTSSELFNVGFQVWGLDGADGQWEKLHNWLVRSGSGNAVEPQSYSKRVRIPNAIDQLVSVGISSVDSDGSEHYYGPFEVGQSYGDLGQLEPIAWDDVRAELDARMATAGYVKDRVNGYRKVSVDVSGAQALSASSTPALDTVVEFSVSNDGLYRITSAELSAAGIDWSGTLKRDIALIDAAGDPVVRYVKSPRTFGTSGEIYFYANAPDEQTGLFTDHHVYRLVLDRYRALNAPTQGKSGVTSFSPSYTETSMVEDDKQYILTSAADDPWLSAVVMSEVGKPRLYGTTVPIEADADFSQAMVLHMSLGKSSDLTGSGDEHVVRGVVASPAGANGLLYLESQTSNDTGLWEVEIEIPANTPLTLNANGDSIVGGEFSPGAGYGFSEIHVDSIGLSYARPYVSKGDDNHLEFSSPNAGELGYEVIIPDVGHPWVFASDEGNLVRVALESARRSTGAGGNQVRTVRFGALLGQDSALSSSPLKYWVGARDQAQTVTGLNQREIVSQDGLLAQALGSSYVLIAHPSFMGASLGGYAAHKQSQGYIPTIINYLDVVDAYGGGQAGPEGLTAYLSALEVQGTGIDHVLLVGGSTYDHTDIQQTGAVTFIPGHYGQSNYSQFTVSDAPYVMDSDGAFFANIGRWPVRSDSDLQTIVAKSILWASTDHSSGDALLIAEHTVDGENIDFASALNGVADSLPGDYSQTTVYVDDIMIGDPADPADDIPVTQALAQAKGEIINQLNAAPDVVLYNGHASTRQLSNQNLFKSGDIGQVTSSGAEVWLPMSCYVTFYESTHVNTLAHQLLFSGNAVNISGAMLLSNQGENLQMGSSILDSTMNSGSSIGEAVNDAKAAQDNPKVDINWSLLGDPTVVF